MVDDDVLPLNINKAVLTRCVPLQALHGHGDLCRGHELGHDLAEEDLGVGILVDFVPLGNRFDEIAIGFGGEPVLGLSRLGLASVQVLGVSLAVDIGYGHGGTSIRWSGLSHSSVTNLTDFMNAPGRAAIEGVED